MIMLLVETCDSGNWDQESCDPIVIRHVGHGIPPTASLTTDATVNKVCVLDRLTRHLHSLEHGCHSSDSSQTTSFAVPAVTTGKEGEEESDLPLWI